MSKLDDTSIATILGLEPPEKVAPGTRTEAAINDVGDLDDRMRAHAEKNRQFVQDSRSGVRRLESTEEAGARIMQESPGLYSSYKAERARRLHKHGVGADAAVGGV